jgi:nitrite reductase/ring-hydroxylating ferredoxin subunit
LSDADPTALARRWFPICGNHDLPAGHIFETELLGQELAVWRDLNGNANVWENRCPHRGMRFTLGTNLGGELRCAYHGYRFAHGSGQCTSVPAQPSRAPPRSLCARIYPKHERDNLIWTRLSADTAVSDVPQASAAPVTTSLYSLVVRAPAAELGRLLSNYKFRPSAALTEPQSDDERCSTACVDAFSFQSVATKNQMATEVRLYTQPVDSRCTVIHGVLLGGISQQLLIPTLKHHAQQFARLRDASERLAQRFDEAVLSDHDERLR